MPRSKIAFSLDAEILRRLDRLVKQGLFPNRSRAIEAALQEKLDRLDRGRLAREAAKLDPAFEQALADEGIEDGEWPEY